MSIAGMARAQARLRMCPRIRLLPVFSILLLLVPAAGRAECGGGGSEPLGLLVGDLTSTASVLGKEPDCISATEGGVLRAPVQAFRGDTREPSLIFAEGFRARGERASSVAHSDFPVEDTAYISTTLCPDVALMYSIGQLDAAPASPASGGRRTAIDIGSWTSLAEPAGFEWQIAPETGKYLVGYVYDLVVENGIDVPSSRGSDFLFAREHEVLASRWIPPGKIRGFWPVTIRDLKFVVGEFVPNPSFEPIATACAKTSTPCRGPRSL